MQQQRSGIQSKQQVFGASPGQLDLLTGDL
jgi:hypothetical protein